MEHISRMKLIRHLFIGILVCWHSGHLLSQLNIEELNKQLASYTLVDSRTTAFSLIQKTFASPDSLELYRIIYNSDGSITNPPVYGSAILHDKLDAFGRILHSFPYLANGETSPSITYQYVYFDSIPMVQINHLSNKGQLLSRMEKVFDQHDRLIEKRLYTKQLDLEWRDTYEFDDDKHLRFERSYDALSNLLVNECGVAIKVQKFPPSGYQEDRLTILEERFYDVDMQLVDCSKHYGYSGIEPYSIVQRIHENAQVRELRMNAKNEVVFDDIIHTDEPE